MSKQVTSLESLGVGSDLLAKAVVGDGFQLSLRWKGSLALQATLDVWIFFAPVIGTRIFHV